MKKYHKLCFFLVILVIVIALGIMLLSTIVEYRHRLDNPDCFVGKTYQQIIKRYGEFDRNQLDDSTGNYIWGSYIVKPRVVGGLGTYEEEYITIWFDENGVCIKHKYVIGGEGG